MHCLYVRLDKTMYPMCVRAGNALMRLCICGRGSSELSMLTCKKISWHVFQIVFATLCLKKKPILVRYQTKFTLINKKNLLKTY